MRPSEAPGRRWPLIGPGARHLAEDPTHRLHETTRNSRPFEDPAVWLVRARAVSPSRRPTSSRKVSSASRRDRCTLRSAAKDVASRTGERRIIPSMVLPKDRTHWTPGAQNRGLEAHTRHAEERRNTSIDRRSDRDHARRPWRWTLLRPRPMRRCRSASSRSPTTRDIHTSRTSRSPSRQSRELEPISEETFENYEGCLSVPNPRRRHRHARVTSSARSIATAASSMAIFRFTAGTFQHEIDHLHGADLCRPRERSDDLHHLVGVRSPSPRGISRKGGSASRRATTRRPRKIGGVGAAVQRGA